MEQAETRPASKARSFVGLLVAGFVLFSKSTKIIAALKLLKFGKPLVTIVSMVISAVAYGLWLGPWFGVGLVAMIFVHEMGHVIALRIKGYDVSAPLFIPFLGAVIFAPKFEDRDTEAFVGYGGPLLGTIGALVCFAAWPLTEGKTAEILLLVSYIGIFLNLFNLIPISPMDGGRITQAIGGWFKYLGLAMLLAYTVYARQPALIIIWLLVLDSFDNMPLRVRPAIGILLTVTMATFMTMGYSKQPAYIDAIDIALACLFTWIFIKKDQWRKSDGLDVFVDNRPHPSVGVRMKWLVYYVGLVIFTSAVLMYQVSHMPHAVKTHSEQLTTPVIQ